MTGIKFRAFAQARHSQRVNRIRAYRVAAWLLGAFGLSGCATNHVGNAWQCPLIQGNPCQSVASADPAAPESVSGDPWESSVLVTDTPLYRAPSFATTGAVTGGGSQPPVAKCDGGCRPRAWVSRLFRNRAAAGVRSGRDHDDAGDEPPAQAAASDDAGTWTPDAPEGTGALQGTGAPQRSAAPQGLAALQGLRTSEVIGRIWIGPYVDAQGIYHEASWVRVVLEPAGWRHP